MVDALLSLLQSTIEPEQARMLALFLFFLPIFFFAYWAVKRGLQISLRPIDAYAALKGLLAQAAEAGQPVHLSLGISGIGDRATADTTAGLTTLEYLAERAAISASPPIVTIAHPTALPVAQDLLRRAFRREGYPEEYDASRVRFIASDPLLGSVASPTPAIYAGGQTDAFAYAAGTMQIINQHKLIANVMIGNFGAEFLLLGETGAQRNLKQIGGTSALSVLPFVYASVSHPLIGEEIYAGGAYLSGKPAHLSSLLAQDVMRWALIGGLALAIMLRTLGLI
ncbi:MAG: hypothetical protein KGJ80_03400 [Chloroflexota bacterium]|nr:hypothetical protein [Chloroflexota bacterium]